MKLEKYFPKDDRFYLLNKLFTPWHYKPSNGLPYVNFDCARMELERKMDKKKYPIRYFVYHELYLPVYRFWHNGILMIPKEIKWFIQRGKRGWADCDAWSYDHYNARVNKEVLIWLKNNQNIMPMYEEGMSDEQATKNWHEILDKMIFAFDCIDKEGKGDLYYWSDGCKVFYETLLEKNPELYKDIHFQTEEEHKKMQEGMQLFIKHYFSLWD